MINVHEHDINIPPGKVCLRECGDVGPDDRRPQYFPISKKGKYELRAVTAGWVPAGSMMRWDNGGFEVRWDFDGAEWSNRYRTLQEAIEDLERRPET